ncbi:hypothetical protein [Actinoplanes philippinensis]
MLLKVMLGVAVGLVCAVVLLLFLARRSSRRDDRINKRAMFDWFRRRS